MNPEVQGFCDHRFSPIQDVFAANFEDGLELGASFALTYQGEPIVDLWAGFTDEARTKPWHRDTLVQVFSTTKLMATLCTLKLIDDALIELDAPIALYWPEFAQAGKSKITVRRVLLHQTGLPGFTEDQPLEAFGDWNHITKVLAEQAPWHEPGTSCYHPITFGIILGELTRRVTGLMLSEYFDRTFAQPLGADFHLGLKDKLMLGRVADLLTVGEAELFEPGSVAERVFASPSNVDPNTWEYMATENPSGNGLGNARSMARIGALFAMNGELDGVRYLSERLVRLASTEQSYADDLIIGPISLGLGVGLHSDSFPAPTPTSFHWGGFGGSWMVMDRKSGVSSAYAMNCLRTQTVDGAIPLDPRQYRMWQTLGPLMEAL